MHPKKAAMPPSTSGRSQHARPLLDITNSHIKTRPFRPGVKHSASSVDAVAATKNLRPTVTSSASSPDGVPSIEELRLRLAHGRKPNLQQSYSSPRPITNMGGQDTTKPLGSRVSPSSTPSTPSIFHFSEVAGLDIDAIISPTFTDGANVSNSAAVSELFTNPARFVARERN
jgi:hypothetical protein